MNDKWIDELTFDELRVTLRRTIDDRNHEREKRKLVENELRGLLHDAHSAYSVAIDAISQKMRQIDALTKRAEAAEARLCEWEAAAANNDPYVTNGGYVEVEVLEAIKRRNAELLAQLDAIPVVSLQRFVEAVLMHGQPLQFDVDTAQKWIDNAQQEAT